MNIETVRKLLAYNRWANEKMLNSVEGLTQEELTRQFPVSFGSLLGVLAHIIGVEWVYLQRWAGQSPKVLPGIDQMPNLASVEKLWISELGDQSAFLANLTNEKLQQPLTYINFRGESYTYVLSDMVQHVVNHSTYHRGQVVFLLRMLDKPPAPTDYLRYFDEQE